LPGPDIGHNFLNKVRNLAFHVNRSNEEFLATKLLDRAAIFNVFAQNWRDSLRQRRAEGDDNIPEDYERDNMPDPVTPFTRYTHFIGHSFEASGRIRKDWINHADLIRGGNGQEPWVNPLSKMFNTDGCSKYYFAVSEQDDLSSEYNTSYQGESSVASTSSSLPLPSSSNQGPGYEIRPFDAIATNCELDLRTKTIP
jgi:hypothetical protein